MFGRATIRLGIGPHSSNVCGTHLQNDQAGMHLLQSPAVATAIAGDCYILIVLLWPPYEIGGDYIFALWLLSFFLSFYPRLLSVAGDWMSTILPHMVCP